MKFNPFNPQSPLFAFRWFIIVTLALVALMTYHDLTGSRMFAASSQQQWNSSGPGYHK